MDDIRQYDSLDVLALGIGYPNRSRAEKDRVRPLIAQFLKEEKKRKSAAKKKLRIKKASK